MMASHEKVVISALCDLISFILTIIFLAIIYADDEAKEWLKLSDSEKEDEHFPLHPDSNNILWFIGAYALLLWVNDIFLMVNARLNRVSMSILNITFLTSTALLVLSCLFRIVWEFYLFPGPQLQDYWAYSVIAYALVSVIRILNWLKSTEMFGAVVRNLELMII